MEPPAIFKGIPASYVIFAAIVGIIFAAGIASLMYQPLPVQVKIAQYAPAEAPSPSVPTIKPAVKTTDPFAPAPAPVVVTTQPLPTITPEQATTYDCDVDPNSPATATACLTENVTSGVMQMILGIMPIIVIMTVVATIVSTCGGIYELMTSLLRQE